MTMIMILLFKMTIACMTGIIGAEARVAADGGGGGAWDFCSRAMAPRPPRCAAAPGGWGTDVEAVALVGSYYEVGSTARYRLRHEAGMGCARTTFTLANSNATTTTSTARPSNYNNYNYSPLLRFESSAVPLLPLISRRSASTLSSLSSASSAACSSAARLCYYIHGTHGRLPEALSRISAAYAAISDASPYDAGTLSIAARTLHDSVSASRVSLDSLARSVTAASTAAAALAQSPYPSPQLLRDLRLATATATLHARDFGEVSISNATYVGALLSQVLEHVHGRVEYPTLVLLQEAQALLIQHINATANQVTNVEEVLSGIEGPTTDMLEADARRMVISIVGDNGRGAEAAASHDTAQGDSSLHAAGVAGWYGGRRVTISSGRAVQRESEVEEEQEGEEVRRGEEDPGRVRRMAYRIVGAVAPEQDSQTEEEEEAETSQQYAAVLVNRCEEEGEGEPINDLIVLSSTPTIAPPTLQRLLDLAASHGLFTDCDAAFVPSLQLPDDCAAPLST